MQYYTILTDIGKAKLANATALKQTLTLTQIAVGDGGGSALLPSENMTELVNQVWIGNISDLRIDEEQNNWIVAESYIASDVGGFVVREVGLFDEDNNLIAVGNYPDSYKPVFESGAAKDMLLRIIIEVSNSDVVELKVDPAVILATREYVDDNFMMKLTHVRKNFLNSGDKLSKNYFVWIDTSDGVVILKTPEPTENAYFEFNTGDYNSTHKFILDGDGENIRYRDTVDTVFEVIRTNSKTFCAKWDEENLVWRIN